MSRKSLAIGFVFAALLIAYGVEARPARGGYVETRGSQFVINGRPFYFNGFNSYWLMYMASDPSTRAKVTDTFAEASKYGMNVARTWAFSDGGYRALQTSPGSYNEDMFKVFGQELHQLVICSRCMKNLFIVFCFSGIGFCGVRSQKTWDLSYIDIGEQLGRFWREKAICSMG